MGCFSLKSVLPRKHFCKEHLFYTRLQASKASASGQVSLEVRQPLPPPPAI